PRADCRMAEDHALALAGCARGKAQIRGLKRAEGLVSRAIDGRERPQTRQRKIPSRLDDVVELRLGAVRLKGPMGGVFGNGRQAAARRQDAERRLDKREALLCDEPAAITLR